MYMARGHTCVGMPVHVHMRIEARGQPVVCVIPRNII